MRMRQRIRGSWRPSMRERLMLLAAVTEGPSARAAWEEWRRGGGDIDMLSPSTSRLLPAVYRNLEAGGAADRDLPRLRGVYRHAWALNQRIVQLVGEALAALQGEGVRP